MIQIYKCPRCKRAFCIDDGFKRKHYPREKVVETLGFYVGGGNPSRFLAEDLQLSKNTILRWVFEYVGKISRFTNKLVPKIIQKVNLDELFLKMRNQFFYLWDAICAESRFAFFYFSPNRGNKDAEGLIRQFKNALFMTFDGAFQYPSVLKRMFGVWWYYHHTRRCKDF